MTGTGGFHQRAVTVAPDFSARFGPLHLRSTPRRSGAATRRERARSVQTSSDSAAPRIVTWSGAWVTMPGRARSRRAHRESGQRPGVRFCGQALNPGQGALPTRPCLDTARQGLARVRRLACRCTGCLLAPASRPGPYTTVPVACGDERAPGSVQSFRSELPVSRS